MSKRRLATKEEVAAIKKAAKKGRIIVEPRKAAAFESLFKNIASGKASDFTLTSVNVESCFSPWSRNEEDGTVIGNDGGFEVSWVTVSAGAGGLTFYLKGGKLHCDNEMMSKDFIKTVLCKLVDDTELENLER